MSTFLIIVTKISPLFYLCFLRMGMLLVHLDVRIHTRRQVFFKDKNGIIFLTYFFGDCDNLHELNRIRK